MRDYRRIAAEFVDYYYSLLNESSAELDLLYHSASRYRTRGITVIGTADTTVLLKERLGTGYQVLTTMAHTDSEPDVVNIAVTGVATGNGSGPTAAPFIETFRLTGDEAPYFLITLQNYQPTVN